MLSTVQGSMTKGDPVTCVYTDQLVILDNVGDDKSLITGVYLDKMTGTAYYSVATYDGIADDASG